MGLSSSGRIPRFQRGGRRFESDRPYQNNRPISCAMGRHPTEGRLAAARGPRFEPGRPCTRSCVELREQRGLISRANRDRHPATRPTSGGSSAARAAVRYADDRRCKSSSPDQTSAVAQLEELRSYEPPVAGSKPASRTPSTPRETVSGRSAKPAVFRFHFWAGYQQPYPTKSCDFAGTPNAGVAQSG